MWRYDVKFINFKTYNELIVELNKMGADGWEVFSYEKNGTQLKGYEAKVLFKKKLITKEK